MKREREREIRCKIAALPTGTCNERKKWFTSFLFFELVWQTKRNALTRQKWRQKRARTFWAQKSWIIPQLILVPYDRVPLEQLQRIRFMCRNSSSVFLIKSERNLRSFFLLTPIWFDKLYATRRNRQSRLCISIQSLTLQWIAKFSPAEFLCFFSFSHR